MMASRQNKFTCVSIRGSACIARLVGNWAWVTTCIVGIFLLGAIFPTFAQELPASGIWSGAYGFFCHQLPERLLTIGGKPSALCVRCVSIYSAVLAVGLIYCGLWRFPSLERYRYLVIFLTPILLDGLTQMLGLRTSGNILRVLTGLLAGAAIAVYLFPLLDRVARDAARALRTGSQVKTGTVKDANWFTAET